jgi:nitric oxide reductase NorE protein
VTATLESGRAEGGSVPPSPGKHVPGEVGAWVFILGDMMIFAVLFVTYLVGRAQDIDLFDASQSELNQNFGAANTLILLTSSILVVLGVRSVRERRGPGTALFLAAFVCGLAFSGLKVIEYADKVHHGLTPATDDFFMYYFVLTALHWFHVILGMLVLLALARLARQAREDGLVKRQLSFVEGGACFWHMVDLLWIVLFPLLYLAR